MRRVARLAAAAALAAVAAGAADGTGRDVCAQASAVVDLAEVKMAGDELTARGTWAAAGNAAGVLLEYRIDSDRMAAEARLGPGGAWETRIPGRDCGHHYFRVTALPLAPDRERQEVCIAKPATENTGYDAECVAPVSLSDCEWDCQEGPDGACTGRCVGSIAAASGPFVPQLRIGDALFKSVGAASPGPWSLSVRCQSGQPVAFRVRQPGGRRDHSLPAEVVCGR